MADRFSSTESIDPIVATRKANDSNEEVEYIFTNNEEQIELQKKYKVVEVNRATWGGKLEFLMTCIGYAVGLGNIWRFPYLCYKNGGGAFLIPYSIMMLFVGIPLFYLEISFGQFASLGPISIWRISPLLKGIGFAMVFCCWIITLYYNVVISHTVFFFFASMTSELPWVRCDNSWNTKHCVEFDRLCRNDTGAENASFCRNDTKAADFNFSMSKTPSEEYYKNYVLNQSASIEDFGAMSWGLALCLLLAWSIVYASLIKGVQSLGKVVYFTATFPYLMLTILLIRGATLEGAIDGIIFYVKPDFSRLYDARVWCDAATQIFFSLSTCTGGLIAMASFNPFKHNCYRDSLIVTIINCLTSIYGGFAIFSILGFMAHEKGVTVDKVAEGGPGLAFEVYPEALARMPVAPLWSLCFFFMMAILGFGSQFSLVECVLSSLLDEFRRYINTTKRNIIFRTVVLLISFILGLPMVCQGGIYVITLLDYSVSGFPLLFVGVVECIALTWIYGFDNLSEDLRMMLGHSPGIGWKILWKYFCPLLITVTFIFNIVQYKQPDLDGVRYPNWALGIGWIIALFPIILIPSWFLVKYCQEGGLLLLKMKIAPLPEWGPALKENRTDRYVFDVPHISVKSIDDDDSNLSRLGSSVSTINSYIPNALTPSPPSFVIATSGNMQNGQPTVKSESIL